MAPKKKVVKMALGDFLLDQSTGSWADEMDSLPTMPSGNAPGSGLSSRPGGHYGSGEGTNRYSDRAEVPFPTAPPYTAFVGNLSSEVTDGAIRDHFGMDVSSVRIMKDMDEKPKGYGYVEFSNADALRAALALSGSDLTGRAVRVTVAEPSKKHDDRGGSFNRDMGPSAAEEDNDWRASRKGPLTGPSTSFGRGGFNSPQDSSREFGRSGVRSSPQMGFESMSSPLNDGAEWARGSKFTPSVVPSPRISNYTSPADFETPSEWVRGAKFEPSPALPSKSSFGSANPSETEGEWARGSKFVPATNNTSRPTSVSGTSKTDVSDWRSNSARPSPPTSAGNTPILAQRKKLNLAPRSASVSSQVEIESTDMTASFMTEASAVSNASSNKSSPFGNAKPIDISTKEAEIAERLEKEKLARKEKVEAAPAASSKWTRNKTEKPADGKAMDTESDIKAEASSVSSEPKVAEGKPKPRSTKPAWGIVGKSRAQATAGAQDEQTSESASQPEESEKTPEVNIGELKL